MVAGQGDMEALPLHYGTGHGRFIGQWIGNTGSEARRDRQGQAGQEAAQQKGVN